MSPELANRATILAAQYAGSNSAQLIYPPLTEYWIICVGFIFLVLLIAVGSFIFDKITFKEQEQIWQEVHYDNRTMGEERSRNRDGQGTQGS
jgi:hypothetical protein